MYDTLFTQLHSVVFPFLGEFFGKMSALATTDYYYVLHFFTDFVGNYPIEYINVWTGATGTLLPITFNVPILNVLVPLLLTPVVSLLSGWGSLIGVSFFPFWLGLLLVFASGFVVVSILRYFISLIP